jgi:FKBP-type peptidyl-prolyl cis-trans isomerase FkpA
MNLNVLLKVTLLVATFGLVSCTKCSGNKDASSPATESGSEIKSGQSDDAAMTAQLGESVKIEDIVEGTGAEAVDGKQVTVHYTGTLLNGTKFDSSVDRNSPFPFLLGAGQVIPGWDQGVKGMKVGGKRKLTIPPQLAYGDKGVGGVIHPNAVLVFDVELISVD